MNFIALSHHRDETALLFHSFDPRADMSELVEGKATFVCDVRVGEERNIGNRITADVEPHGTDGSKFNVQCST